MNLAHLKPATNSPNMRHNPTIISLGMARLINLSIFIIIHHSLIPLVAIRSSTIIVTAVLERELHAVLVSRALLGEGKLDAFRVVVVEGVRVGCPAAGFVRVLQGDGVLRCGVDVLCGVGFGAAFVGGGGAVLELEREAC